MQTSTKGIIITAIVLVLGFWLGSLLYRQLSDMPFIGQRDAGRHYGKRNQTFVRGREEIITLYAREKEDSDRMIARKAILIRRPNAVATVFVFHGFMCDKQDIRFLTNALFGDATSIHMPVNTLTIDFRAHGELAEGQCCTLGLNEMYDVLGAVKFVKSDPELAKLPRVAYGFSMGAVASILAQGQNPTLFDMAIWDCPFDSTKNIIARAVERLKINVFGYEFSLPGRSLLERYAYNSYVQSFLKTLLKTIAKMDSTQVNTCILPVDVVEVMKNISIPFMIIGCRKDDKSPLSAVRALYNAGKGYKRLWITNGRGHFDSYFYNPEKYIYKVRRFIQKALDDTYKSRYPAYVSEDPPDKSDTRALESLYSW